MKFNNLIYITFCAVGFIACEPEFDNPIDESNDFTNGEADFSNYVALGNSITAGFASNALYITGQENSFPNILATNQFAAVGGGDFVQPLAANNAGGLLLQGNPIQGRRLVLAVDGDGNRAPLEFTGLPIETEVSAALSGPFNNMGVPGAKSYHLLAPGYGNIGGVVPGLSNPYFVRFASSPMTSIVADALAQNPTFFSLWIGNNDILGYATSGGTGVNQTGNLDPSTYGPDDITDPIVFSSAYNGIVNQLTGAGAKGVLITLPDVTSIPFFTTVPNNALVLDAGQAANLTGFFQAFVGIATVALASPPNNIPPQQAQAIAAQYALTFSEGPNRFLIKEESPTNPFGFRQMTEEELLVLTIDQARLAQGYGSVVITPEVLQVLGLLQMGGTPTPEQAALVLNAVSPIEDGDVLDNFEIEEVSIATEAYNATIRAAASTNSLALYDANAALKEVADTGISFNGGTVTAEFGSGGAFSLDGVHPTPRVHAIVANGISQAIEATYNANLPSVDPGDYGTITLSDEVN